ncbi:putative UPF0481 protein At3g02645 [Triticum dicoccoides]|uniref:putative UPF0481 protein At3g02645 n=1 Tax=Triticum dicoccoides TaxID=85692 RepID=UPI0018919324|nr:putative UPF0481 protein At3g02645 [Triticum dicoccoides]
MAMGQEWVSVTGEEKHLSSWVVDVEKMLADDNAGSRSMEEQRWKAQSIYLVPEWLKGTNSKAYQPQLVSLGPFHHGDPILLPMEEHKRRALVHLIKRSESPLQDFISAIDDVAEELQAAYGKDLHVKWRNDRRSFVDMMLTDGCFLLEFICHPFSDYEWHDPVFSRNGRFQIGNTIWSDMLLVEIQLPLLVLKKILGLLHPLYLQVLHFTTVVSNPITMLHKFLIIFLLLYRASLTYNEDTKEPKDYKYEAMPSALEIHQAGIKFRKSERNNLLDINFKGGVLTLPEIDMTDETECACLNLMAFERLHFDVTDLVTAYVLFMDDMIISAKDVALLRSSGILKNFLGCDKKVAKLFNGTLNRGQLLGGGHALHTVVSKVNAYRSEPWHEWRATLMSTYFRNPWAFISLAAATILLIATLLQTAYAVMPNKS